MLPRIQHLFLPLLLVALPSALAASSVLFTDSVSYCAEAKAILIDDFGITYHRANQSVTFDFSLASVESNLNVSANIYANAYGIDLVNQTLNLCSLLSGVLCPLPQFNFSGYGTYPIPSQYTAKIPSIAFSVPNLEAYARIELIREGTNEVAACLQATLSNGLSTRQPAVEIVTGILALVALLVALVHAGAINSPSPAQYRWFDVLFLFQAAAASGLLHLNYPLVYSNFTQNFFWALGLFYSPKVESSIDSMRLKTGGHLSGTAYSDVQYINRKLSPFNVDFVTYDVNAVTESTSSFDSFLSEVTTPAANSLVKRVSIPSVVDQNATTDLDTGLPVYVNTLGIPSANAFSTIFFYFLAFIAIAITFHVVVFAVVYIFHRAEHRQGKSSWATRLRRTWWEFCEGNALRLCLIWFFPIWIFGFYQFKIGDSKLAIFFAVLSILLTFVPLAVLFVLSVMRNRTPSSTAPTISPLYTSYRWFHSVGVLYRAYRQRYHFFWFAPVVLAMIARAGFIAFGNSSGWAQVIGNMVVEFLLFLSIVGFRPHKDRKGDWLGGFLAFARLAAWGLLVAFIPSVGVKPIIRTVIGFVIIVVFGVQAIILFIGLIWNAGYGYLWRRHTHRIEDGLEVERFVASDNDSQRPMQHIDAANFVSSSGAAASRSGASLGRGTSIIEPIGNVYEPSLASHHHPSNSSGGYTEKPLVAAAPQVDPAHAYAEAADGRGLHEHNHESGAGVVPETRATSPAVSGSSRPQSMASQYYTPAGGITSPTSPRSIAEDQRSSGQYFPPSEKY